MAIKNYKGMDANMQCRGFQYEVGGEYETDKAKACKTGFHACEMPLDVFNYYAPADSRFFEVEQDGDISRENGDSKVASTKLKVGAEIGIPGLVKAQIEYVKARTTQEYTDPERATAGEYGAATARGSAAVGENGCALVRGNNVKAKGGLGSILVICEEFDNSYGIKEWKAVVVDGEKVKSDTWYTLKDGEFVEVE